MYKMIFKHYVFNSVWRSFSLRKKCVLILNNGSHNVSKSLLINVNNDRYLINCGEGTQKFFFEHGHKINMVKNIFLTQHSSEAMMGLTGLALGMCLVNNKDFCIHGYSEAKTPLIISKKLIEEDFSQLNYNSSLYFEDDSFKINSFRYQSDDCRDTLQYVGYLFSVKDKSASIKTIKKPNLQTMRLLEWKKLCKPDKIYATVNKFLVLDCPSIHHVSGIMKSLPFDLLVGENRNIDAIFHLTDKSVFNHSYYQQLIKHVNSLMPANHSLTHIVVDSTEQMPGSYSSYFMQTCFNHFVDADIFPKLKLYEKYIADNSHEPKTALQPTQQMDKQMIIFAEQFQNFNLYNISDTNTYRTELWSQLKTINKDDVLDEILNNNIHCPPEYLEEKMKQLKEVFDARKKSVKNVYSSEYPNVTFLGTASTSPNKYRNISGILIEAIAGVFVLFDCGEGTLDRILMLHGLEHGNEVIRNIRLICISHHHLDHHSGLYTILRYRQLIGLCQPCLILAATDVYFHAHEYDTLFQTSHCQYNCNWCQIDLLRLPMNHRATNYPRTLINRFESTFNLQVHPARVYHTQTSYGFALSGPKSNSNEKWKIVYSGDNCPKFDFLRKVGMNCDLLIHEATFDDNHAVHANMTRHSTVTQAIEEGIKMNAKFTMLTHFSSRHPLVLPVEEKYQNVAQAFDFMKVTLRSCHYLKVFYHYLKYWFPKHWIALYAQNQRNLPSDKDVPLLNDAKLSNIF